MPDTRSVCLLYGALLAPLVALASASDSDTALVDIVVTAQKYSQDVQDVGVQITAMNGPELQALRSSTPTFMIASRASHCGRVP